MDEMGSLASWYKTHTHIHIHTQSLEVLTLHYLPMSPSSSEHHPLPTFSIPTSEGYFL